MKSDREISNDMLYWIETEGLTYALETLQDFDRIFSDIGFVDVSTTDASDWYRLASRREYELVKGDLYAPMVDFLGQKDADYFVENWRAMVVVCESGEMRQGYCRGRRPDQG